MEDAREEVIETEETAVSGPEPESAEVLSWYQGDEIVSWNVDEFERHQRGLLWYVVMGILAVALILYSIISQNFLFAVIVVMFGVIIGLSSLRDPHQVPFVLTTRGIGIGDRFYPFKEFRSFWVLYEPPEVKNVYIEFKRSLRPHLVIPLYEQDPLALREVLIRFLEEDVEQEDEPLSDIIGRALKL